MERRIIRKAYKLYTNGYRVREIARLIRKYYGVSVKQEIFVRMFGKRLNYNAYSQRQLRLILYLYQNFYNTEKLIWYLKERHGIDITKDNLMSLASKYGVRKRKLNRYSRSFITYQDEKQIVDMYLKGYSTKEIAQKYGFKTLKSVTDKLKKHGITPLDPNALRKQNKTYADFSLEVIDTKEKAYLLGLLLTDGYVDKRYNRIALDLTDKDVIEFLSKTFSFSFTKIKKKKPHHLDKYRIVIHGEEHLKNIGRLGLVERKSKILPAPRLYESELKYIPYIMRGIIDGDGWVRKDGKEFFIVSGSEEFIKWCKDVLLQLGMKSLKYKEFNGAFILRSALQHNIEILKTKIYTHPFGMMRKYLRLMGEGPSETTIGATH